MKQRFLDNKKANALTFFKGVLMGCVELIPGVSAGTIALVTGILPRLLRALKEIKFSLVSVFFEHGFVALWRKVDASFLVILLLGMLVGVASLVHLITFLLSAYPILIWSFFFGLILASSIWLAQKNSSWRRPVVIFCFFLGLVLAFFISTASMLSLSLSPLIVFLSGMLAVSAMILPGLSGSFIMMLMGVYEPILNALKNLEFSIIVPFLLGAVIGLLVFAHVLSYLFNRFRSQVYALLTGILIGSLNRIWPWQEVLSYRIDHSGDQVPVLSRSISPMYYEHINNGDPSYVVLAIVFASLGALCIILLSRVQGVLAIDSADFSEKL